MTNEKVDRDPLILIEAEQQLIGAALLNNDVFHQVGSIVAHYMFADPVHAKVWAAIDARVQADSQGTPVTISADLASSKELGDLGGTRYLVNLCKFSVAPRSAKSHAETIRELYGRRELVNRLTQVADEIGNGRNSDEAAQEVESFLQDRVEGKIEPRTSSMMAVQTNAVQQALTVNEGRLVAVPTGLPALDNAVVFMPGRYTIAGGATSMGKTALAVHVAKHAAENGFGVAYLSREMSDIDMGNRFNAPISRIPYKAMDRPLSPASMEKYVAAAKQLANLPIEIMNESVRDVPGIVSECKKIQRKMRPNGSFKGLKLLVVDYIQLVRGRGETELVRLSQVANDLKSVAKRLDLHVLALAQLDRRIGERDDPRPRTSDLRGSGDLENAPDNVIFIHRPEYYLERQSRPKKVEDLADFEAELDRWRGKAEILIRKARMGEIADVTVGCAMGVNRFWGLDEQEEIEF